MSILSYKIYNAVSNDEYGFKYYANQETEDEFGKIFENKNVEQVDKWINYAMENSDSGSLKVSPGQWFDAITIDLIKKVEDKIATDFIDFSTNLKNNSIKLFYVSGGIFLLIFVFSILLSIYITKLIVVPLNQALNMANDISQGILSNIDFKK
jgi:hypothetical protein